MKKDPSISKVERTDLLPAFERLVKIMDELREQCPWDKQQTFQSLRHLTIEETFELSDAILENDLQQIKGELGDVLLHVVFYAKLGEEKNEFTLQQVIETLCEKLIERHPHIYGNVSVKNIEEVQSNWEKIKLKNTKNNTNTSVLSGVPRSMPSLLKAMRVQEKVSRVGFDWEEKIDVKNKVIEELDELLEETSNERKTEEFGDLLFSLINYARFEHINPDEALEKTNKKFIHRFQMMEQLIAQEGAAIYDLSLKELDQYWETVKKKTN